MAGHFKSSPRRSSRRIRAVMARVFPKANPLEMNGPTLQASRDAGGGPVTRVRCHSRQRLARWAERQNRKPVTQQCDGLSISPFHDIVEPSILPVPLINDLAPKERSTGLPVSDNPVPSLNAVTSSLSLSSRLPSPVPPSCLSHNPRSWCS